MPYPDSQPQALTTEALHVPEVIASELGWGPNKPYLVARSKGWTDETHIQQILVTPGVGKKPDYVPRFTEALRQKLLDYARSEVRPVALTRLQTDVLVIAERLGVNQHPVWMDGTDLAEFGYPHGNRSMDRTVNELVELGVLVILEKPNKKRRGKYVARTQQPVSRHPGAALVRDVARRSPAVRP